MVFKLPRVQLHCRVSNSSASLYKLYNKTMKIYLLSCRLLASTQITSILASLKTCCTFVHCWRFISNNLLMYHNIASNHCERFLLQPPNREVARLESKKTLDCNFGNAIDCLHNKSGNPLEDFHENVFTKQDVFIYKSGLNLNWKIRDKGWRLKKKKIWNSKKSSQRTLNFFGIRTWSI